MDIGLVLVECSNRNKDTLLYSSSGLMLDNKFVLITANVLVPLLQQTELQRVFQLAPGKLCSPNFINKDFLDINIIWPSDEEDSNCNVKKAHIFSIFLCNNIINTSQHAFKDWAVDCIDNNFDLNKVLSLFFVLTLDTSYSLEEFKGLLTQWWHLVKNIEINNGDELYAKSASFGSRHFIGSYSRGIVSNILGNNSCLILSDCPSTPGSEGSPIYKISHFKNVLPLGLILSSVSWWKGEWVGMTLVVDVRSILIEILDVYVHFHRSNSAFQDVSNFQLIENINSSLVQVYCGPNWGTGILLDDEKGIILTNAHEHNYTDAVKLFWNKDIFEGSVIFKTAVDEIYDIAVIKCNNTSQLLRNFKMKSLKRSYGKGTVGDIVYAAGFSLFPKDLCVTPTLSKGCISQNSSYMLKTTCCVHPGQSGGAILTREGFLLGIIVSNVKLDGNGTMYPRVNMAIPFVAIAEVIEKFLTTDGSVLYFIDRNNVFFVEYYELSS